MRRTVAAALLSGPLPLPGLLVLAELPLLLEDLRRLLLEIPKVLGLEHRADFDLAVLVHRVRGALDPLDSLVHGLGLDQPESGDELLRLGEGAVDHRALLAGEPDALAFRARMEAFAREHHPRLDELLIELAHLLEKLNARHHPGFGILRRLHQDHESHLSSPLLNVRTEKYGLQGYRTRGGGIDTVENHDRP